VQHAIIAFDLAGFKPGTFFNSLAYQAAPLAANAGFTFRL
jgi:hypothetical protein